MAGYTGTPLPKKLGIKEGARVAFVAALETFRETLAEQPHGGLRLVWRVADRPVKKRSAGVAS